MSTLRASTLAVTGLLLAAGAARPSAQEDARRVQSPYGSSATAILVDVVVRDRQGRPITDLRAADFVVTEDNVAQKVDSFTRVSRGGGIGVGIAWKSPATRVAVAEAASTGPADEPAEEGTTALVFDGLSPESMRLAQRATLGYIPLSGESPVRVGVFESNAGVRVVQGYTTDRARVREAIGRLVPSGTAAAELKTEREGALMDRRRELKGQTQSVAAGVVAGSGAALARSAAELGERENELRLVQTELNMMRSFENLDRDHKGYDTSVALLTVIRSLAEYPGRKTVVLFSEGLPVSPALSAGLDAVIDAANRANVTAYAVDAHGLRATSTLDNLRKEVNGLAEERFGQVASGSDRTDAPLTMAFERVEDTLKLDSRTGLARLAEDTGGFLVEGSNDLSSAFRRIDEDKRFHYLLTYAPTNATFDGKFRRIQVKVHRPGAQVFARKGYRALRTVPAAGSATYENEALSLLDKPRLPSAFPIASAGYSFPDPSRPGLTPVLVRVGTSHLRHKIDSSSGAYSAHVVIVVRVVDPTGRQVEKLSQEYVITGDAKNGDAARDGEILFYREPQLAPGVYTMQAVVYDAFAGHGSARLNTVTVARQHLSGLAMSDVVLVSRVENVASPAGTAALPVDRPLVVGNALLYPNMGEAIRRTPAGELPFYFALYGKIGEARATAQLLRSGTLIAEAPVALAAPSGSLLRHVGRLAVDALPAGTYELKIVARSGADEVSTTAFFTLVD